MSSNDQLDRASIDDETMIYRYRDLLGWPITRGAGGEFELQTGDTVCAADLPVGLAGEVQATLRLRMLDGPVVLVPGRQHRWMLLARPPDAGAAPPGPVAGIDLRVITEGPVALPPSGTPRGPLRWVVAPSLTRPWLPPLPDIVAAVRAAVSVR